MAKKALEENKSYKHQEEQKAFDTLHFLDEDTQVYIYPGRIGNGDANADAMGKRMMGPAPCIENVYTKNIMMDTN